jgi:hypothetical protein
MFDNLMTWLGGAIQNILDGLQAVVDALNPFLYILRVLDVLVSILPSPADLSQFYDSYIETMNWLAPSLQLMNHFINLPVFGVCFFTILAIETFINVFRAWRMLRSFIT